VRTLLHLQNKFVASTSVSPSSKQAYAYKFSSRYRVIYQAEDRYAIVRYWVKRPTFIKHRIVRVRTESHLRHCKMDTRPHGSILDPKGGKHISQEDGSTSRCDYSSEFVYDESILGSFIPHTVTFPLSASPARDPNHVLSTMAKWDGSPVRFRPLADSAKMWGEKLSGSDVRWISYCITRGNKTMGSFRLAPSWHRDHG